MPKWALVLLMGGLFALAILATYVVWDQFQPKNDPTPQPVATQPEEPKTPSRLKYNVVFVSFDALGASHVGHLGHARKVTPTIDAMAHDGYAFAHAYSVSSWTVPASMTWFTGNYPSEHRMVNKFAVYTERERKLANLKQLSPDLMTLAEIMKRNGAVTAGFTGNAGVSGGFGYEQGFDVYFSPKAKFGSFDESIPRALAWLEENKDERFFLFLHGYDVHGQCTPAGGYDYRFRKNDYDRRYTGAEQEQEILREEGLDKGQLEMRAEDVRFWRAVYDEKVERADAKFRHFLDEFDKLGLTDTTLFVLTSDHGTEFYEHRRFDHGFTLYDELIHVPLVIKLPGQSKGRRIEDRVSSIDVMPTILDLTGAEVPERARRQMRGKSLAPALHGEPLRRDVFSETNYREYTYKRSIVTRDGLKLIYTLESKQRELYDLNEDPGEKKDLAATKIERADELEARLFAHFKHIGHDLTKREWKVGFNPVYPSQSERPPRK